MSAATLDSLAGFETSREDLEDGGNHEPSIGGGHVHVDAEPGTSDDEPDHEMDYLMCEPH